MTATANLTDLGTGETYSASWDWGDEATSTGGVSNGSVTGSHAYSAAGIYTVTLTVTGEFDNTSTKTFTSVIVFDPAAGFVTGGGWFDSPAGALTSDPTFGGKVNFGFDAKYHNGAHHPTGNTEIHLGNDDFMSTGYDWMVVTDGQAVLQGTGTLNRQGSYRFRLVITDGKSGTGTIQLSIWELNADRSAGITTYDTQRPVTLGGGSIVIHS